MNNVDFYLGKFTNNTICILRPLLESAREVNSRAGRKSDLRVMILTCLDRVFNYQYINHYMPTNTSITTCLPKHHSLHAYQHINHYVLTNTSLTTCLPTHQSLYAYQHIYHSMSTSTSITACLPTHLPLHAYPNIKYKIQTFKFAASVRPCSSVTTL